jgi:hypothetical protein
VAGLEVFTWAWVMAFSCIGLVITIRARTAYLPRRPESMEGVATSVSVEMPYNEVSGFAGAFTAAINLSSAGSIPELH